MRRVIVALLLAATAACGKSSTAANSGDELGTYALVSVDGKTVPCDYAEGGNTVRILAGTLTFSAGGSIRIVSSFTVNGQSQSTDVSGSYTRSGNNFTMHYTNGGANTGTLSGSIFTMQNEGVAMVYARSSSL